MPVRVEGGRDVDERVEYPFMTAELAERIEKHASEANLSRVVGIQKLQGNPLRVEFRSFEQVKAFVVHGAPYLELHRAVNTGPGDEAYLREILDWFHEQGTSCEFDISPFRYSDELLHKLAETGFYQHSFLTVLYGIPEDHQLDLPVGVTVREFPDEEAGEFARLCVAIDNIPEPDWPLWTQVVQAQFTGWRKYIAYVGGNPAAHAALWIQNFVGVMMYATTHPEYRGYGCQVALLRRRVADAGAAQCDLVVSSANPGTISQRNQERAGLRTAYNKALWTELRPPG